LNIDEHLLGYFPRESAREPEAFTGERLTSAIDGQVAIEHYHRYLFARAFCLGRDVVDVASGEGYGSAQLAQVARQVVGIEYARETARLAARNFARPNLRFVNADARFLPLRDASADVVVSFETIEHFAGQEAFVEDVRRVLRPDGCFIVSTPERDNYAPTGVATNPHHVRELSRTEFDALLGRHFRHRHFLYQRPMIGSALVAEIAAPAVPLVFERRAVERFEATIGLPRPVYIVAIASNAEIATPPNSLYIERGDIDTEAGNARRALAASAESRAGMARAEARAAQLVTERDAIEAERAGWEQRAAAAERVAGSLRLFLRQYLPRLRAALTRS
jgi:SAM-dependent methyltransferase